MYYYNKGLGINLIIEKEKVKKSDKLGNEQVQTQKEKYKSLIDAAINNAMKESAVYFSIRKQRVTKNINRKITLNVFY